MWYFQKKGRTEGPIQDTALHLAIEKGEIGALDLLFRQGDSRWRPAYEYDALKRFFTDRAKTKDEDHWIILSRNKDSKESKQRGPFRTSEVKIKLRLGEIKYTDYAWKQGMKEWYRITALEIFHGESRQDTRTDVTIQTPELPPDDLLQNVEVLKREPIKLPEEKPREAEGPDLTQTQPVKVVEILSPQKQSSKKLEEKPKKIRPQARSLTPWDRFQEMSPSKKWFVGVFCIAVAIIVAIGSLFLSSYQDHHELLTKAEVKLQVSQPAPVPAPVAPTPEPVAEQVTAPAPMPPVPPKEPEAPKVEPSYLKMKVSGDGTDMPVVDIQTDASVHFPILLSIMSELGEVVGYRSYFRQVRISDLAKRKYELRDLGLKPGRYRLKATIEEFEAKGTVSISTSNSKYRSDLAAFRKNISYYAMNERVQLIKLSERLDDHNQDFISKFRAAAQDDKQLRALQKNWQKKLETISSQTLKTVSARSRGQYVFGEYWVELKDLRSDMFKNSLKAVQAKAVGTPDWQAYMVTVQKVKAFNEKVLAASLWK